MRNILLLFFILLSTAALSQSTGYLRYDTVRVQKIGGNSTLIIENATRNLDGAFLQNYSQGRTRFAHALDSVWVDGDSIRFRYGSATIAVLAGGGSQTLQQVFDQESGNSVLNKNDTVSFNYGNKKMIYRYSPDGDFADFDLTSIDTIQNPDNFGATNQVGFRTLKTFRIPSYSATTYHGGATLGVEYQIKDSAKINTFGQDFGFASRAYMQFTRMSGYTGKSVYEMGNLTMNDGVPIHLASTDFGSQTSTAGTNYKYVKGYVVGHTSYAYLNANDTIENFIGFNNMGFFPFPSHIKWSADYVGGYLGSTASTRVAKPWSLYMWNSRAKNYLKGNLYLGDSTITHHQLAVYGSTLANDSIYANYTLADSDSSIAVPNTAWVKRNIASGGGGGERFGVSGEDDQDSGSSRSFSMPNAGNFILGVSDVPNEAYAHLNLQVGQTITMQSYHGGLGGGAFVSVGGTTVTLKSDGGNFIVDSLKGTTETTLKQVVWDSVGKALYVAPLGGGGSSLFPTTGTGTATGNVIGYLDGNKLEVQQGGQGLLVIDPPTLSSSLSADDGTGNSNIRLQADVSGGDVNFSIRADDDNNIVQINGDAVANTLAYTADTHTFTGAIYKFTNIPDSTTATNYMMVWNSEDSSIRKAPLPSGGDANLLFDSLGDAGHSPVVVRDDTLMARRITGDGGVKVDTTSSGGIRIYGGPTLYSRLLGDSALTGSTSAQTIFPDTQNTFTLEANTTYEFEGFLYITAGTTSHTKSLSWDVNGSGLTTYFFNYQTMCWNLGAGSNIATQATANVQNMNATNISGTVTVNTSNIQIKGMISTNAGGTITPMLTFSADPTGTILLRAGSYLKFTKIGDGNVQTIGAVN